MKKQYKELYYKIDEILWSDWDPVGINDIESIRDEYRSYVPHLVKLKEENADLIKIASHLYRVETVDIGVCGSIERCKEIAQKIINL